jgi:hypothetical protein
MAKEITLREHVTRIGKLGGKARMKGMTEEERAEFGRLGGQSGGAARAAVLTSKRRSEIAKKAALARWGTKKAGAKKNNT